MAKAKRMDANKVRGVMDDVFLRADGITRGPTVRCIHGQLPEFKIDFPVNPAFLTDKTRIVDRHSKTIGEANRRKLHAMLDEYLDEYLRG